jgi:hypothetical protein
VAPLGYPLVITFRGFSPGPVGLVRAEAETARATGFGGTADDGAHSRVGVRESPGLRGVVDLQVCQYVGRSAGQRVTV